MLPLGQREEPLLTLFYLNITATAQQGQIPWANLCLPSLEPSWRLSITNTSDSTSWPLQLLWESSCNQSLLREPLNQFTVNTVLQSNQQTGPDFKTSGKQQKTATLKSPCTAIILALIFGYIVVRDDLIEEEMLGYFLSVAKHFRAFYSIKN